MSPLPVPAGRSAASCSPVSPAAPARPFVRVPLVLGPVDDRDAKDGEFAQSRCQLELSAQDPEKVIPPVGGGGAVQQDAIKRPKLAAAAPPDALSDFGLGIDVRQACHGASLSQWCVPDAGDVNASASAFCRHFTRCRQKDERVGPAIRDARRCAAGCGAEAGARERDPGSITCRYGSPRTLAVMPGEGRTESAR